MDPFHVGLVMGVIIGSIGGWVASLVADWFFTVHRTRHVDVDDTLERLRRL